MSLDLGALLATADINTVSFDRKYTRLVRQFADLAPQAEKAAAGTASLDEALAAVGTSSDKAAAGLTRTSRASTQTATAEQKAAVAAERHAAATSTVNAVLTESAGLTKREQQAVLGLAAAQDRLTAVERSGTASTRQLAAAQASLIGAQRRVAAAQDEAAVSTSKWRGALAGTIRTAGELGLIVGGIELVKKAIDIGKEAAQFQQSMLLIKTNANASTTELQNMTKAVLALSPQVATKPNDLAAALYHVEQNGLRGAKALEALRVGAMGAKIGMADVEDTTNTMTIAVASGMRGVDNLSKAMGAMIAAAGTGDMRLKDLNEALGTGILSIAKGFGASMQDVAAILATLGDNGIRGVNAAQGLRQVLMGFAKPAATAKEQFAQIGLSVSSLKDEMTKHGLVAAMNLLEQHMTAAGITGKKVGAFITDAFGRKSGASLGVLMGEMDRVNTKFGEVGKGAASFQAKWAATTQTTAFAFQRLGAEAQVAGIKLAQKLTPEITAAANWLAESLPAAVRATQAVLAPLEHEVAGPLSEAWHLFGGAVKFAAAVLGGVGHVLEANKGLVADVATVVLAMWAAWKGYAIVRAAALAVDAAFGKIALRADAAAVSMARFRTEQRQISGGAFLAGVVGLGFGISALGHKINSMVESGNSWAHVQANLTSQQNAWKDALVASNGALDQGVRLSVAEALQQNGIADKAAKAGVSLGQLTDAVIGNRGAFDGLVVRLKQSGQLSGDMLLALTLMRGGFDNTAKSAKAASAAAKGNTESTAAGATAAHQQATASHQQATALQWVVDAHGRLVRVEQNSKGSTDAATNAMTKQTQASTLLKQALDLLNGVSENLETATDQFSISLGQLRNRTALATDAQGHHITSLKQSTVAGAQNRQMLVQLIDAAKAQAQATADQVAKHHTLGTALRAGNAQLKENEDKIRAAAAAAGLDKGQTDNLIRSLGVLSHVNAKPKITLDDQASAKLIEIKRHIDEIHGKDVVITTTYFSKSGFSTKGSAGAKTSGNASGGSLPEGVSAVGERGPELAVKSGPDVQILSNAQSREFLSLTGMRAPGFAGGTSPGAKTPTKAQQSARQNAANQVLPEIMQLIGAVTGTTDQLKSAYEKLDATLKQLGATHAELAQISSDQKRLVGLANKRDRIAAQLGAQAAGPTAYDQLAAAKQAVAGEVSNVRSSALGMFDINSVTGTPGPSDALRTADKSVRDLRRIVAGEKTLKKRGLNAADLAQLAENPATAGATIQTLLGYSKSELQRLNKDRSLRSSLGGQLGQFASGELGLTGTEQKAQHRVDRLIAQEKATEKAMAKLTDKIGREAARDVHVHVHLDGREIDHRIVRAIRAEAREIARVVGR